LSQVIFAIALCASLFATSCFATDYYVDGMNGDDANSGISADDAWKTITHAIDSIEVSEEKPAAICVSEGIYSPSTNGEAFPLMLGSHVSIEGEDPGLTILDGEYLGGIIESRDASNSTLSNLSVTRASFPAIYCPSCTFIISGCHIVGNRGHSTAAGDLTFINCRITDNNNNSACIGGSLISCLIQNNSAPIVISNGSIRDCLIEGNIGTIISTTDSTIEDTVIRSNMGDRILYLERYVAIFRRCVIESNIMDEPLFEWKGGGWWQTGVFVPQLLLEDCLIADNTSLGGSLIHTYDLIPTHRSFISDELNEDDENDRIVIRRCVIADNHGQRRSKGDDVVPLLGLCDSIRIQDSVFSDNSIKLDTHGDEWSGTPDWPYNVDHCCLETEAEGEGNFVADPLFVSGPFGDYYLSCVAAGQEADSPCIDAGSMSAAEAGLASMATRTDGVFDTGTLDIGYHYSATPPTIDCEVSGEGQPLLPGGPLVASFRVENAGLPIWVDIYAGFILPDGTILLVTPNGFTTDFAPFIETVHLPAGYASDDITVFDSLIPDGLPDGTYVFAAALSLTGSFRPIGDIAAMQFAIAN
ncbi:MAG: right-handed parallel beta-helix repeat-containing protein, partial [Candidatus Coatesbacteria bacterium]|nr:right-handed parallel beta-helix repeat-containing protein [Candidatus Coatesbacteria bacterium]